MRESCVEKIEEEIINVYASESNAREAVFNLRKALTAQAMDEWSSGRLHDIRQAPFLLAFMCQLSEQGWAFSKGISRSRKKATREMLRGVRINGETSCSSCGRKLDEQRSIECSNSLHLVSSLLARHAQEEWGEAFDKNAKATFPLVTGAINRVSKLRGYGNSLCAPQAQAFIEAVMETL